MKDKDEVIVEENYDDKEKKESKGVLFYIIAGIFAAALAFLIYDNFSLRIKLNEYYTNYQDQLEINSQLESMMELNTVTDSIPVSEMTGTKEILPSRIRNQISGITLTDNSPVKADDLSYLTVPYYNFSGETSIGHMIVNKDVADEVLEIFDELRNNMYPIQSMEIAEEFDAFQTTLLNSTEDASLGSNNTCCLYYKKNGKEFSPHSYGLAIDLNPKINPAKLENGSAIPKNAGNYLSGENLTDTETYARIEKGSDVYKIFTERGWKWGGENNGDPFCFYKELD